MAERPFIWRTCMADIYAVFYPRTLHNYLENVIAPALLAIETSISDLAQSAEGWAPFALSDMEVVRCETLLASSLAVQSLWERQLRTYLQACASQLRPGDECEQQAQHTSWQKVENAFSELRQIPLSAFPSHPKLTELNLLGNVARHGGGASEKALRKLRPDFWLNPQITTPMVSLDHLRDFVAAIIAFWEDAETIYLESLDRKHENVVAELARRRAAGRWFPPVAMEGNDAGGRR
ncbi:hypothetical protein OO17_17965 [Rhodopseudomonas palustris]|uniref:Uncharacterized protein n=2 Tax=Nitrobacteraceae TaxID=41294 RepID=A0A0D7EHU4_RHOPL|nr:hypothetical protein OO17_17965 [Rhodopseudomonas palustris]